MLPKGFWTGYLTASIIALLSILLGSVVAHCSTMENIIRKEAIRQGLDPEIALSVAHIESNLNPKAIGPMQEVGLFQIRPRFSPVSRIALFDPKINAQVGITMLLDMKDKCPLQDQLTWVICFNNGFRKPKHPLVHPYYKRFIRKYEKLNES